MSNWSQKLFGTRSEIVFVLLIVGILLVLFTPIPAVFLDFLLISNLSVALLILLLTFYIDKPLSFSTFPSLLLIATLFRLALNITATRLILGHGYAGHVIDAIGNYVVSGNYVIGLVVFLILIVVQYLVVTNGAQRVAEVAARFTLDSMPGKQMSIDADLNMGLIDEKEARLRRDKIEKEANFYGAMDGASKFVKGDAIAGILILLIDIIGGFTVGLIQRGMDWSNALQSYTLLTIGDGIVTQIPALIISIATGIIVTRAATDAQLSSEVAKQISAYPKTLVMIGIGLMVLLFLPRIPFWPVLILLLLVGSLTFFHFRKTLRDKVTEATQALVQTPTDLYEAIAIEPIEILLGKGLIDYLGGDSGLLMDRIQKLRKTLAFDWGWVLPKIRIRDQQRLINYGYEFYIQGITVAKSEIRPRQYLAINSGNAKGTIPGISAKEPTYGLPATWIEESQKEDARRMGFTVVDALNVLMTHLTVILRKHAPDLLTRNEVETIVEKLREKQSSLINELIPNVMTITDVHQVLQQLVREKVSIRNLEVILEECILVGKKTHEAWVEAVRGRLGASICQPLTTDGTLHVLRLDSAIEHQLYEGLNPVSHQIALEPSVLDKILNKMVEHVQVMLAKYQAVLLCSPELRRPLKRLTERILPQLTVLSIREIPPDLSVRPFGLIQVT